MDTNLKNVQPGDKLVHEYYSRYNNDNLPPQTRLVTVKKLTKRRYPTIVVEEISGEFDSGSGGGKGHTSGHLRRLEPNETEATIKANNDKREAMIAARREANELRATERRNAALAANAGNIELAETSLPIITSVGSVRLLNVVDNRGQKHALFLAVGKANEYSFETGEEVEQFKAEVCGFRREERYGNSTTSRGSTTALTLRQLLEKIVLEVW